MPLRNQNRKQHIKEIEYFAIEVFGSEEKDKEWLGTHNLALGATPSALLTTDEGAEEVRKVLASIARGGVV